MGSQSQIDISILVVSYNTREMTLACLDSIARETRASSHEVIVVDNASSDGSAAAVGNHPIEPRLFALKHNIGFARANNLAARHASGRYILLLNPDTVVLGRAIDRLREFAEARPAAMIWGGRTQFVDGTLNPASCWSRMTPWNLTCRALGFTGVFPQTDLFNGEAYGGWLRDTTREVDIVSGCFLMMPRALWEELGGFDERFFMYGEEADLCLRARALGARPQVTPAASIIHHGGASEATRAGKTIKLLAAKASLIDRHWSPLLRPVGLALLEAWPLSRWLARTVEAAITGSAHAIAAAATWREVWSARRTWRRGYGADGSLASGGTGLPASTAST